MKTILYSLSIFLCIITSKDSVVDDNVVNNVIQETVVFDGKEGNLYFFTNSKKEALTIQDDDDIFLKYFTETPNDFVDKSFKISIDKKFLVKNVCSSKHVTKIELKE